MAGLTTSQILALADVAEDKSGEAEDKERESRSLEAAASQLEKAGHTEKAAMVREYVSEKLKQG